MFPSSWYHVAQAQALDDRLSAFGGSSCSSPWVAMPDPAAVVAGAETTIYGAGALSFQHGVDGGQWLLPAESCGAVSFCVHNPPQQLAVELTGISAAPYGYVVVLGDAGQPASVLARRMDCFMPSPLQDVQDLRPAGWRFSQHSNDLWLSYVYGVIRVGTGSSPDDPHSTILLQATDRAAMPGCNAIGFGSWRNDDARLVRVTNVRLYRRNANAGNNAQHRTLPYTATSLL